VRVSRNILGAVARVMLPVLLASELTGCRARPAEWPELGYRSGERARSSALQIVPQTNREVADLSPDDVVLIGRRIGFTDEQILDLGTQLHDALLFSGAARVFYGKRAEALLRVESGQVFIYSASRGLFVYDLSRRVLGFGGPPGSSR
jgi:hypothetical protein